ncbi:hypothetical protein SODALDRAFT_281540 [Sodiomyces alkalinus F11]|uniref:DUF6546 domain-containing protein n=1 Tax=Sodiomyces alkalinus (strain CBS 110278 / VKM F-3762 / F11) TaxID=1314773 RepID=A0A3N2PQT8_SODAK|nr:hypothetical protein SODALDRAFT_281540 [Sodiomyces alkalinus F11]ROT36879.1 hypothetical protein SODALDRAFT_281540 [Sodiomyces alkalinus F11]
MTDRRVDAASSSWDSLPWEIRLQILGQISRQKHRGWAASCAAVCKEWQTFVEPRNFYRLNLRVSCLEEFKHMVVRQRHLVQHVRLNIELPRYGCRACRWYASTSCMIHHSTVVGEAIQQLFSNLSTWKPTGRLVLELNAFSTSDAEHWFKFTVDHTERGYDDDRDSEKPLKRTLQWHDPRHGWVFGQQVEAPCDMAITRLFDTVCIDLPSSLPEVEVVTGFILRRELRRQILPQALEILLKRLPQLQSVVYEPWRVASRILKRACDIRIIPSRVKSLSIFEDPNDQLLLAMAYEPSYADDISNNPSASPMLVRALVLRSQELEHLSISLMVDARRFFNACRPSHSWHHLRFLTLTSSILRETAPREDISSLLRDAGVLASHMPQLETMVLWNSRPGEACAAIYQRKKASPIATLTWRGTWDLELSPEVVKSWEKVASSNSSCLWVEKEQVQGVIDRHGETMINSHGDAIHHLRLPGGVIDPVSLFQLRREGTVKQVA